MQSTGPQSRTDLLHLNDFPRRYVLGDWGTSHLRLFLFEDDVIGASSEGPGIGTLAGTPADALARKLGELIAPWIQPERPMDVTLSGMIGSRNGLFDVPYASLPVDQAAWARAAWRAQMHGMNITIATGLRGNGEGVGGDVMRGEETQIFGALRLDAELATGFHLFVLPGTHSKWVEVRNGSVVRFRTVMSGEVYALLSNHSILLKSALADGNTDSDTDAGFSAGIERCKHLAEGLLAALFETRIAQLLENRSRGWAAGFLSGLLIGYEVTSLSGAYSTQGGVKIVGEPALASLYRRAFSDHGVEAHSLDGAACAIAGLHGLRACARSA